MAKPKKKKKISLRKLVYNDKYLIICSILAALIIWVATSMNLSPETTKKITVPVTVDFSDTVAEQLGIKLYDTDKINVEVTVTCKKYLAKDINAENINASLQTSSITSTGYHSVPISVSPNNDNSEFVIESYSPTSYEGFYDVEDQAEFPVELNYINDDFVADGYVLGTPALSENNITIVGPKTYVSQVKSVVADVDVENTINTSQVLTLNPLALDKDSNEVKYVSVNSTEKELSVTLPILKKTTLDVGVNFINAPDNPNSIVSVSYSKDSLDVGVLEDANINQAILGNIDFTELSPGKNEFTFDTSKIDGITVLDGTTEVTVTVTVPDDYDDTKISVSTSDVSVTVPSGYKASITQLSSYRINVIGDKNSIKDLKKSNLKLSCNVKEEDIKTGKGTYPLSVSVLDSSNCWVSGTYTADLYITKE